MDGVLQGLGTTLPLLSFAKTNCFNASVLSLSDNSSSVVDSDLSFLVLCSTCRYEMHLLIYWQKLNVNNYISLNVAPFEICQRR